MPEKVDLTVRGVTISAEAGMVASDLPVDGAEDQPATARPSRVGWISPFRVVVVVVVLVASFIAWELTRGSPPAYRTAVVATGTAVATLDSVGTITPANQADLNFSVSGTVGAVDVAVGQQVTAGQVVASLETAPLEAAVVSAQASLASANLTLANDEASQTASSSTTSSSSAPASGTPVSTTSTTQPSGSGQTSQNTQQIAKLQAALLADQKQEDLDVFQATADLQVATTVCEASTPATTGGSPAYGPPPTTTTTTPGGPGGPTPTCTQALGQASAAQAKVAADTKKVAADESALNAALGSTTGSGGGASSGGSGTPTSGSGGTHGASTTTTTTPASTRATSATGAAQTGASSGTKSKVVTSQQLAVDQASIDSAQANLGSAQQSLGDANLASTIAGTVASLSIAPGSSVSATSSSTANQIVVIGSGSSYEALTNVPVAQIGQVAVGQQVLVTPDSTNSVLTGKIAAIGVLGSTAGTTTTYPVTISLDSPDLGLFSGAEAKVSIVTKKSVGVTTVPSSAVRTAGSIHLVTVVDNNSTKSVRVTLGTVGDILTQVSSGVARGQVVTMANLNEPLPSSSSTSTRRAGLGAGGFGGGGLGAGGFGGGGLGGSRSVLGGPGG